VELPRELRTTSAVVGFAKRCFRVLPCWMETIPFHCLHSFAKRSGGLLGRRSVQPKSRSRPIQSATPANGKGMEARESGLESPGFGFRVRTSDLLRFSVFGFRFSDFRLCRAV
jgi:hypothetical protein